MRWQCSARRSASVKSPRGPEPERRSMSVQNDKQALWSLDETRSEEHAFQDQGSDFVLIEEGKAPSRIELARERMLISRLYLGLLRTITDDYGAVFARPCKSNRARPQTAARNGAEAAARVSEGPLCGTRRQCLSRHGQSEHPRFAK